MSDSTDHLHETRRQLAAEIASSVDDPAELLLGAAYLCRDPESEDYNRIVIYAVHGPGTEAYPMSFDPHHPADVRYIGAVLATEAQILLEET